MLPMAATVDATFPEAFAELFQPFRYKVYYGGRGGGKTWAFARAILLLMCQRKLRVLCTREYQNSIRDSVHKVLADQISKMGLDGLFEVQRDFIYGPHGGEIFFKGLHHNSQEIKSTEGVDICWVEEAHSCMKSSWDVLLPTIRKADSEIWISFNPNLETDDTYKRFVKIPQPNSIVRKVTWRDNPFLEQVAIDEMLHTKATRYADYLHVWEGECRATLEGAVYAEELHAAQAEGRLCRVHYNPQFPVDTFWDLGFSDTNSIWCAQTLSKSEVRIINFYQNRLKKLDHYLQWLQRRNYTYGTFYIPHDGARGKLTRSVEEELRGKGFKVRVLPRTKSVVNDINACRTMFANCWFDVDNCADGLTALRHYQFEIQKESESDTGTLSSKPLHNEHSHGADAFRTLAIAAREPRKAITFDPENKYTPKFNFQMPFGNSNSTGWMGH